MPNLEGKCLVFLEFYEEDRMFVVDRHELALGVSVVHQLAHCQCATSGDFSTYSLPLLKLDMRSERLFRSTQMSGVRM